MVYISDVEQGFLPWLVDCVEEELNKKILGRVMLDAIIREVAEFRQTLFEKKGATEEEEPLVAVDLEIPEPPVSTVRSVLV